MHNKLDSKKHEFSWNDDYETPELEGAQYIICVVHRLHWHDQSHPTYLNSSCPYMHT